MVRFLAIILSCSLFGTVTASATQTAAHTRSICELTLLEAADVVVNMPTIRMIPAFAEEDGRMTKELEAVSQRYFPGLIPQHAEVALTEEDLKEINKTVTLEVKAEAGLDDNEVASLTLLRVSGQPTAIVRFESKPNLSGLSHLSTFNVFPLFPKSDSLLQSLKQMLINAYELRTDPFGYLNAVGLSGALLGLFDGLVLDPQRPNGFRESDLIDVMSFKMTSELGESNVEFTLRRDPTTNCYAAGYKATLGQKPTTILRIYTHKQRSDAITATVHRLRMFFNDVLESSAYKRSEVSFGANHALSLRVVRGSASPTSDFAIVKGPGPGTRIQMGKEATGATVKEWLSQIDRYLNDIL